jgi:hypothetical protein
MTQIGDGQTHEERMMTGVHAGRQRERPGNWYMSESTARDSGQLIRRETLDRVSRLYYVEVNVVERYPGGLRIGSRSFYICSHFHEFSMTCMFEYQKDSMVESWLIGVCVCLISREVLATEELPPAIIISNCKNSTLTAMASLLGPQYDDSDEDISSSTGGPNATAASTVTAAPDVSLEVWCHLRRPLLQQANMS